MRRPISQHVLGERLQLRGQPQAANRLARLGEALLRAWGKAKGRRLNTGREPIARSPRPGLCSCVESEIYGVSGDEGRWRWRWRWRARCGAVEEESGAAVAGGGCWTVDGWCAVDRGRGGRAVWSGGCIKMLAWKWD